MLAPALLKFTDMLGCITHAGFMPDLSRSGRFRKKDAVKAESSGLTISQDFTLNPRR